MSEPFQTDNDAYKRWFARQKNRRIQIHNNYVELQNRASSSNANTWNAFREKQAIIKAKSQRR